MSTISRQPAGLFKPNFACERILVPDVSYPLLGVGGPRRAEKGGNEIFVTIGVNGGILAFWWFLSDISATRGRIRTKFYLYRDKIYVCLRAPSPSKNGVVSFVHRTATISSFLSVAKCGSICRAQTCAHSGIEPSTLAKGFLQGGPKVRKNSNF